MSGALAIYLLVAAIAVCCLVIAAPFAYLGASLQADDRHGAAALVALAVVLVVGPIAGIVIALYVLPWLAGLLGVQT